MRLVNVFAVVLLCALPALSTFAAEREKFAVYYSDANAADQFKPYQLVVLDSTRHPPLAPLKEEGKTVLGYISLGEVSQDSPSFLPLKNRNLLLQENQNWKGNYFIDLRDPLWAKMVLEELVPNILRQGFDGLFLDTLDDAIDLEETNPTKYAGMTDAAAHIIAAIRLNYPNAHIMMNRAYGLLPKAAKYIDMEMGESVYANYDFNKKAYRRVQNGSYASQVKILQQARQDNPGLKIYTLDYADPADRGEIADIYRTERANGFIPYVATIGLDRLIDEPGVP